MTHSSDAQARVDVANNGLATTLAKWLIPSFGVLFALVGYAANSAHRSLLGFPDAGSAWEGADAYTADATDFLRDLLTRLGNRVMDLGSLQPISLAGHGLWLLAGATLAALAFGLLRRQAGGRAARTGSVLLMGMVLALLTYKFVRFDAPLMRINDVIVGVGVEPARAVEAQAGAGEKASTLSLLRRLKNPTAGRLDQAINARARVLWHTMVCSRPGTQMMSGQADFKDEQPCAGNLADGQVQLSGEYEAQLLLGLLLGLVALGLLLQHRPVATTLALLALAYLLTLPYDYGKLIKPVDYTYALVRFQAGTLLGGNEGGSNKPDSVNGFVIASGGSQVTLLLAVDEQCSTGSSTVLRFASVPASRLLSIEQIYERDVITWSLLKEKKCPTVSPF